MLHARLSALRRECGDDKYLEKDLLKAVGATSLLGEGGPGSSTERYVRAAGDLASVGSYRKEDRVFVSANGDREGRVPVVDASGALHGAYQGLSRAFAVGATIVADMARYREDPYNVGGCPKGLQSVTLRFLHFQLSIEESASKRKVLTATSDCSSGNSGRRKL